MRKITLVYVKSRKNMNPELSFNFSETEEHKVGK